ncbi:MAG: hypothetical protein KDA79_17585, partial [Planctomycetaceae bacterium]|nr:hypothetical protein [Planctomycetaceae bacterium]
DDDGDGEDAEGQLFRLPESGRAITKGSFTAWTIPEDPEPKDSYLIVIQIRLPEGTRRYRASDLSGFIKGTDGFTQAIPWDRFYPTNAIVLRGSTMRPINARSYLPIKDGVAQLAIKVLPPNYEEARKRGITTVQDTIMIQSRRLAEKQTLSIEF